MEALSRHAALALLVALALVAPVAPALADEGAVPAGEPSAGHLEVVAALAAEFAEYGMDPVQVGVLHDAGLGLGEIFRLYTMALVSGVAIPDLLAQLIGDDGELELGFGEWKHRLTPGQLALLGILPRNLGQLVAATHRPAHAGQGGHGGGQGHGPGNGGGHGGESPGDGD